MSVLSRNRKRLSKLAKKAPEDPVLDALKGLQAALGDFLVGEAERHAHPCALVNPDGSNPDALARGGQCEAIDVATTALTDVLIKGLVDTAPPAIRQAILVSQRKLRRQLSPTANGDTTSSSPGSQGTDPPSTVSEADT